ncbi:MAG: hypothetical protein AB1325_04555 [Nitrospirota bacterium]
MTHAETVNAIIAVISALISAVTAIFVICYWRETQKMKLQMIEQNKLAHKQLKSSNMPILDLIIEDVKLPPDIAEHQPQFSYDLFLINKGSGPAFDISIQRLPSDIYGQKETVRGTPDVQIKSFQRNRNIIGKDEKILVYREHSNSYRAFTLKVSFYDIFRDRYEWEFQGDREGLSLKRYEILRAEDAKLH